MNPRKSLRLRLTLYYAGLFLLCSTVLVGATYVLVRHNVGPVRALVSDHAGNAFLLPQRRLDHDAWRRTLAQLALAFGALSALSIAAGWFLAGRALRPMRDILRVARRVTEENLRERIALQAPPDELKQLADAIDAMLERVDVAVAAQRRFIADASHELRTPLAVMRAGIDVSLSDPDASEEERQLATAALAESVDRSEALIQSMLALARAEQASEQRVEVDLAEIAAQSLAEVTEQIEERGLELATHLEPAIVRGDPALLRTLVANLLRNAVLYNRPRGSIAVDVEPRGSDAVLIVSNSGDVVLEDEVEGLFEPFRRSRASRSTGAGLGLAIVKSVVESHNGRVSGRAFPSGGLEVEVLLPPAAEPPSYADVSELPAARRRDRLFLGLGVFVLFGVAAAVAFTAFGGAVALARIPVVDRSDAEAARGVQAFPLVWAGMSEANVRRVAGTPTWAAPNRVCQVRLPKGVALTQCWPGERCLEYGDVDSSRSVEFCFRGGLVDKREWVDRRWRELVDG
jgi:signal transduction histidine kinase